MKKKRVRAFGLWWHLLGLTIAALFILPFFWAVVASLRQPGLPPPRTVEWWPQPAYWDNYAEIFRLLPMGRYILNSLSVVAVAVPLTLVMASLAGFGLSQLYSRRQRRLALVSILLMLIPGMAVWPFRFHVFYRLGLIDSLWALIAPAFAAGSPLFVLLFYWVYFRIPSEVYESAQLDGANAWTVWRRIAQPLAWPMTAAVAVLAFTLYWSDFTSPVLYIFDPARYTLPIGLQLLKQMDQTNYPLLMAGAVIMAAPVIILFIFAQRLLLHDLSLGKLLDKN